MNISSIVIKTTQETFTSIKHSIQKIKGCEIYLEDEASNQLIIVLEAQNIQEEIEINKILESLPGVINANMHYTYQEEEINAQLKTMDDGVCEFLNDDSIPAEQISYSGSITHLMNKNRQKKT